MTNKTRLIDELEALHSSYVGALNTAVDAGQLTLTDELAADYERDAIMLMAEREGRHDLLVHFGLDRDGNRLAEGRTTALRRLADTFNTLRAARPHTRGPSLLGVPFGWDCAGGRRRHRGRHVVHQ